jgi:hypothetical protein
MAKDGTHGEVDFLFRLNEFDGSAMVSTSGKGTDEVEVGE